MIFYLNYFFYQSVGWILASQLEILGVKAHFNQNALNFYKISFHFNENFFSS